MITPPLDKDMNLEPTLEGRTRLMHIVQEYTDNFLDTLSEQKAYQGDKYNKVPQDSDFYIDEDITGLKDLLGLLHDRVDQPGLNPASGGHLGYIPGGGIYTAALGDFIAAVTNRYAGVFYASPGAVRIENALIRWAGNLIGYKKNFAGNLTSGGSIANLTALAGAKTAHNIKSRNIENSVIYTTKQTHHSVLKALRLLSLDECVLRYIPTDIQFKMQVSELENQIENDRQLNLSPFLVIANAGSTDVGATDDLQRIAAICTKQNLWLHVDAAYGGFFMLTEHGKKKLKGIELADSVVLDPHKGLFLPYGTGIVLLKQANHLLNTFSYSPSYMQDAKDYEQELSPMDLSPEMSRNFRGLRMWLPLKIHGVKPFEMCLNEKLELMRYFCESIQKLGFELGHTPDLTVAVYRYNPQKTDRDTFNRNVLKKIHDDGKVFISSTNIDGAFWLRIAILSFRTHKREIDILINTLRELIESDI